MHLLDTAWGEDYIPVRSALVALTGGRMREGLTGQYVASLFESDIRARGHLWWRRCLGFVLLACCAILPLLAHASPPDPTWLPGIYDNADYDDVIGLLTDTAAVRELPLVTADPACLVFWSVLNGSASIVPDAFLLDFRLRSPPTI